MIAICRFEFTHEPWRRPIDFEMTCGTGGGDTEPAGNSRWQPRKGEEVFRLARMRRDQKSDQYYYRDGENSTLTSFPR